LNNVIKNISLNGQKSLSLISHFDDLPIDLIDYTFITITDLSPLPTYNWRGENTGKYKKLHDPISADYL